MIIVNTESGVFHSRADCPVAQHTRDDKKREVVSVTNGLRCRVCYTRAGDPR